MVQGHWRNRDGSHQQLVRNFMISYIAIPLGHTPFVRAILSELAVGGVASRPAALKTVPDVVPAGPLTAGWMRQLVRVNAHDRSGDFRAFG